MVFGALGYAAFGETAPPAFLDPTSVINKDYFVYWAIAGAATVTNATVSIPIFLNTLNRGLEKTILPKKHRSNKFITLGMRTFVTMFIAACACTPISYFAEITGLIPMCSIAFIALALPALFYWILLERKTSRDAGKEDHSSWKETIKGRPVIFALHILVVIVTVLAVIFGFWNSLEDLINAVKDASSSTDPEPYE